MSFSLRIITFIFLLLLSGSAFSKEGAFAIVTASPIPPAQLSLPKAKLLFSGKTRAVKGIGRVKLADFPTGNPIRVAFYDLFLNKNEAQMNRLWASLAFSGRAQPPIEMADDSIETLKQWLMDNPDAVGYLPLEHAGGLNVLLEIH
ncbi:hypothetical protein [Thaumasiovibrio subtropicus]|uniref:hypothetical protein n=1 Tax=Thaumasiovibrio subtropicus TaxID=1891207 RepID=UPI000B35D187|nr:hypothetical protein [Thaumasiovibrio subtropicus]